MSTDGSSRRLRISHPLRWVPEFLEISRARFRAQGRVLGAAFLVGAIAGLGAVIFSVACNLVVVFALRGIVGFSEAHPPANELRVEQRIGWLTERVPVWADHFTPWLLLIVPTIGGLISGYIVFRFAPEAEGHGTDAAIAAYHYKQGYIRPRVPLIKIVASAVTIGTGGSGGREGPIAQIGAGFGSILGRLLKMKASDRRVLLAAGVGAGIAAIFRAPLAGALFAAEVLYRSPDIESEVIIPAGVASVVSYCTFGMCFGWEPLFTTPPLKFEDAFRLLPYTVLGLAMAATAMFYTRTFNGITHLFRRLPISNYYKPPIGAFLSGLIGFLLYQGWWWFTGGSQPLLLSVLSFGYGILQEGLLNQDSLSAIPVAVLIAVALGKIFTTSLTIGSGGSGGVFGPSMVIGGCAGGALGVVFHQFWPELVPNPASYMIVGMAGFFAAAGKVPLSTLVIVCEMTGDYFLLLPALWVCTLSYLLSDEQSLYESQVQNRSHSPAHKGEYVKEVLAGLHVSQFLKPLSDSDIVHPDDSLPVVIEKLSGSAYAVLPVVDGEGKLMGVVVLEEVHLASQSPYMKPWVLAADLMRSPVIPLKPGHTLDYAQEVLVQNDLFAVPVVDDDRKVVGIVKRSDIARIYLRHVHGESGDGTQSSPSVYIRPRW